MAAWIMAACLGLVIGSFVNVVIWRVPRNESVILPGSHCPTCEMGLAPQDLIPVVSYIAAKGRCRYCHHPISWEYPIVELINAVLYLILFRQFRFTTQFWLFGALFSTLVALSFIDLHHGILPNRITIPGIVVGLVWGGGTDLWRIVSNYPVSFTDNVGMYVSEFSLMAALLGAVTGAGVIMLVVALSRGGMGLGDVKLNAMIGAFLGWQAAVYNLFIGAVLGSVVGIILLGTGKKGRKDSIPFGPYLAMGAIILTLYRG